MRETAGSSGRTAHQAAAAPSAATGRAAEYTVPPGQAGSLGSGVPGSSDGSGSGLSGAGRWVPMGYDWVVVGAGLTGVTFARRLAEAADLRVLVVDERDHVGGNVYDEPDAHGVLVQRYGAHIFHTGSALVFDYLTQFTQWFP
ncbi:MAG: UDP-galactopyranose mutase, partial [Mycobacterium sp.]|nr:UDP-galactopyranose mutase [Mycobacterium sp.]